MRQTHFKTASVTVKVSPSIKLPDVKTVSVTKTSTPATYGKDKEVYPDKF